MLNNNSKPNGHNSSNNSDDNNNNNISIDELKMDDEYEPLVNLLVYECISKVIEFVNVKNLFLRGVKLQCKHLSKSEKRDVNLKLLEESLKHDWGTKENETNGKKAFIDLLKGHLANYIDTL